MPPNAPPLKPTAPAGRIAQLMSPSALTRKLAFAGFFPSASMRSTRRMMRESDKRGAALKKSIVDTRLQFSGGCRIGSNKAQSMKSGAENQFPESHRPARLASLARLDRLD